MRRLLLRTVGCTITGLVFATLNPMFKSLNLSEGVYTGFVTIAGLPLLLTIFWLIDKYVVSLPATK
jgi:hypothetical protein